MPGSAERNVRRPDSASAAVAPDAIGARSRMDSGGFITAGFQNSHVHFIGDQVEETAVSADGTHLFAILGGATTSVVSWPIGSPEPGRTIHQAWTWGLGVSPDGRSFVAIRNERRSAIWTLAMTGSDQGAPITDGASADEGVYGIAWTPDGRIVYTTEASGNPDIWIMNADGSRRVQLTSNPGLDIFPRVTHDGRYIVFVSDRDGSARGWRMALDGSGATQLTAEPVGRFRLSVSNDDKWVFYDDTRGDTRKVSIDGGPGEPTFSAEQLASLGEPLPRGFHEAMPSPDGTMVAGHYGTAQGERIVVIPMTGGPAKRFDTLPPNASWAPDGRSFVFTGNRGGVSNLLRVPIGGGDPLFVWGWVPFVDPDPMLSYFTCDQVTTDPEEAGYNDANWCSEEYDALYEEQKVELDEDRRREIVADMLRLFNREATYLVLLQDPDLQAYRTDRFEGWLHQPADIGPVMFTNSSPTYANLSVIGGGGDDDGGLSTGLLIGIIAAGVVLVGGAAFAFTRSRKTADERE